jgi:FkbM family methyltransferase
LSRFKKHIVRHDYGGFPLDLLIADPLARGWYDHDWPELPEIALLRQHQLKPGARVFDLGAHQCVVALMLAKDVGPDGLVVAVEANEHNAAVGRKNIELNRVSQVTVLHAGASDHDGELTVNKGLNAQVDDGSGEWGRVSIPAWSVDGLANQYGTPQVLFIDVEGYELRVLQGAKRTLETLPDCFVEVHVDDLPRFGGSVNGVRAFFPADRYWTYAASEAEPQFRPFSECAHLTCERFFLVAIARGSDVS